MSSEYSKKLREIRIAEGLTQPKLAELTGVSLGSIRNYETGQADVGLGVMGKIIAHPRFKKYALWLMTNDVAPESGQIAPSLSPDGQEAASSHQKDLRAG